ncbi:MAG: hypothetical protein Q7J32_14980 [Sphingomonadaceae bacterium]|nr:hypothetical protein [Sphingomonadaceae bacterium]
MPKSVVTLYDNPAGKLADFDFAWLRVTAKGQTNSAAALAFEKLTLRTFEAGAPWDKRAWKSELLLPAGAPDILDEPRTLFERIDTMMPPQGRRDLGMVLTFWTPATPTLHRAWEQVRAFVRTSLVDERGLPVLVVQHAPHLAGQVTPPHIHALVSARRLTFDLGAFTELEGDTAQLELFEEWSEFRAAAT